MIALRYHRSWIAMPADASKSCAGTNGSGAEMARRQQSASLPGKKYQALRGVRGAPRGAVLRRRLRRGKGTREIAPVRRRRLSGNRLGNVFVQQHGGRGPLDSDPLLVDLA